MFSNKIQFKWDEKIGPICNLKVRDKEYTLCFCHKIKDRSIEFFGLENYFCSRCLGVYIGFITGFIFRFIFDVNINTLFFLVLTLPLIIDGFSQFFDLKESNNLLRIMTGLLFGIGIAYTDLIVRIFLSNFTPI